MVLPLEAQTVRRAAAEHIDTLPGWMKTAGLDLLDELHRLDERVAQYDEPIQMMARADDRSKVLMVVPGIGATTATALIASICNGHDFRDGRQLAAWLGLVPGQYSSGGNQRLGRITKADGHRA